jgi:hypothetical protein
VVTNPELNNAIKCPDEIALWRDSIELARFII